MCGGQEHELTMRTAELIDDNAQQALELLIRYGTSSRMSTALHLSLLSLTAHSCGRPKSPTTPLHHFLDTRDSTRRHHQLCPAEDYR